MTEVKPLLHILLTSPHEFNTSHCHALLTLIMRGEATSAQIAGFLLGMKHSLKDECPAFIVVAARVLRENSVQLDLTLLQTPARRVLCDIVGTGGDGQNTFNVSTASGIVCAGAGLFVVKHGNRSSSSNCGSADILESLQVNLSPPPSKVASLIESTNFAFLFAPHYHPAMSHVAAPRKELGIKTIFNFLGPLSSPAKPQRMVVGVYSVKVGQLMAESLALIGGLEEALVVCGHGGLDEISPEGPTNVWHVRTNLSSTTLTTDLSTSIEEYTVNPSDFGIPNHKLAECIGSTPSNNAQLLVELLENKLNPRHPVLDFVLLNSAALLVVSGKARGWIEGVEIARESIRGGRALKVLQDYIRATNS